MSSKTEHTETVLLRLSEEDKLLFKKKSQEYGFTMSDWIRMALRRQSAISYEDFLANDGIEKQIGTVVELSTILDEVRSLREAVNNLGSDGVKVIYMVRWSNYFSNQDVVGYHWRFTFDRSQAEAWRREVEVLCLECPDDCYDEVIHSVAYSCDTELINGLNDLSFRGKLIFTD